MNMKVFLVSLIFLAFLSCKEAPKEVKVEIAEPEMGAKVDTSKYPEALNKVFDAHGGIENWKSKKTITFEMPKPDASEIHTIDLKNRNEKIETAQFSMGHDGENFWLADTKEIYKGDPVFYHNLMFYFYAMPFVLADDGINYEETENLEFEGVSYPGIRVSYDMGVGVSSKDEYFLYYNPETFQMAWLGYTVTYRSGEKSEKISLIRYNDWMKVSDMVLPNSLTWQKYEDGEVKEARSTRVFENVVLSETAKENTFFMVPENGKVIERK